MPKKAARWLPVASLLVLALSASVAPVMWGCSGDNGGNYGGPPTSPAPGGPSKFDLGPLGIGASASKIFTAADTTRFGSTIKYHCTPHQPAGMTGVVIVSQSGAQAVTVQVGPSNQLRFSPDTARVAVGGTVTWTNVSAMTNHTATQD